MVSSYNASRGQIGFNLAFKGLRNSVIFQDLFGRGGQLLMW
jgi:hypothetical protein